MRFIHTFCGWALALQALAAGYCLLGEAAGGRGGDRSAAGCLGGWSPAAVGGLGLGLLALSVLYLLSGVNRRRNRMLAFDNEGGTVGISTDAIRDFVLKLAPEFPAVVRMIPEVRVGRGTIDVLVGVRINAGVPIHETCELLQQRVRERMVTGLGISQVRRVEVSVTEIVGQVKTHEEDT